MQVFRFPDDHVREQAIRCDAKHRLVGVQTALHQHLTLGGMDEVECLSSRGHAVQCIDYLEAGNTETYRSFIWLI